MRNRSLVLLSGEPTSIPEAEARALFLTYDPSSRFTVPEPRVLLTDSLADPLAVASRIAFSRRVGPLLLDPAEAAETVRGRRVRVRTYSTAGRKPPTEPADLLRGLQVAVDLENPEYEFSVIRGEKSYVALSCPSMMRQHWSLRRPRRRPYFHPSAIFPKLSRALVNLSRCREGEVFLDPFAGTGSLVMEAAEIGAEGVACDLSEAMVKGSLLNMKEFHREWLGVVRCDSLRIPVEKADAVATDIPYGRASSTMGRSSRSIMDETFNAMRAILKPGSRMVLVHPSDLPLQPSSDWTFEEEHFLYVHKRLTRAITVLRRR